MNEYRFSREREGVTMRKSSSKLCFLAIVVILIVAVALISTLACGSGDSGTSSSTTIGSSAETTTTTVAGDETTTTVAGNAGGETTTSVDETVSTTSSTEETTTTTEAALTTDTADHTADFRAQYPSTESFTDSTWATLAGAPASHIGAAVDVMGQPSGDTVDPDSKYLTWQLSVPSAAAKTLCRTNVGVDRSLLSGGGWVEVRGIVVGAQDSDAGGGPIIYVQSIQKAAAPTTTAS
jgi:hypothetical protein